MHMNNNPRIYLWIALALVGWLNYQAWMTDYGPRPGANTVGTQNSGSAHNTGAANDLSSKIPQASKAESPGPTDNKSATASGATSPTAAPVSAETAAASAATAAAQAVHVHTDVLDLDISTLGATISKADLLKYTKVKG